MSNSTYSANNRAEIDNDNIDMETETDMGIVLTVNESRAATNGIPVSDIGESGRGSNFTYSNSDEELLTAEEVESEKIVYQAFKRFQDVVLSLIALLVLLIPMLIVSLIICITSPGAGPIFKQERVGKNGKRFNIWKFRSMIPNAEARLHELQDKNEMDGPVFKIKDDPRMIPFGRIIRRTSIDELPQLVNILMGDMSIVGPRPALPKEVEQYDDFDRQRLLVTPGLTCSWQVRHSRNSVSFKDWMKMDVDYIRNRSTLGDWKLIGRTIMVVLKFDGE